MIKDTIREIHEHFMLSSSSSTPRRKTLSKQIKISYKHSEKKISYSIEKFMEYRFVLTLKED
jgi:hypothetical protein